jgi:general secretion pathway protein L
MRERLFIYLPNIHGARIRSLVLDSAGQVISQLDHEQLADLAPAAANRRVTVFVPATDIGLIHANIPTKSKQKMLKAVPYAVEDLLADDVETLHFALGRTNEDGDTAIAVAQLKHMQQWIDALAQANLEPDELIPDVLALPYLPNEWTIFIDGDNAAIRTHEQQGFACDATNLAATLEVAFAEAKDKAPQRLRLMNFTSQAAPVSLPEACEISEEMQGERSLLHVLAENITDTHSISLLQGSFSRQQKILKLVYPWIPVAAALAGWMVLHAINTTLHINRLDTHVAQLIQQQKDIYKRAFPDAKKMENPRKLMESKLKELRGNNGPAQDGATLSLLSLLDSIAPTLRNAAGLNLGSLNFRGDSMVLEITMGNLEGVEQLKQQLATLQGVVVEVQSVQAQGDKVMGRLKIQGS